MEEKQNYAKRFWLGVFLIILSLIIGKVVFITFFIYRESYMGRWINIFIYLISWVMILIGIFLCGKEGWHYSVALYKSSQKKVLNSHKHVINRLRRKQ